LAALCLLAALAVSLIQPVQEAEAAPQQQRGVPGLAKVKVGEFPPDFELPVLRFGEDGSGNPIGIINDGETIRISDYFGNRPLCMIMSSYT
jgi:hypothetical protein